MGKSPASTKVEHGHSLDLSCATHKIVVTALETLRESLAHKGLLPHAHHVEEVRIQFRERYALEHRLLERVN